jgi:hypothetical protein
MIERNVNDFEKNEKQKVCEPGMMLAIRKGKTLIRVP